MRHCQSCVIRCRPLIARATEQQRYQQQQQCVRRLEHQEDTDDTRIVPLRQVAVRCLHWHVEYSQLTKNSTVVRPRHRFVLL